MLRDSDFQNIIESKIGGLKDVMEGWREAQGKKVDEVAKENGELRERIEEWEARGKNPGKSPEGNGRSQKAWREYETRSGRIVELPASVKMVDALPPQTKAEVSFERWLPAALLGDKCEDKVAVGFLLAN